MNSFQPAKEPFHVLLFSGLPIFQQLQIEEALLRCDSRNWFLINLGSLETSIVLGISGKVESFIDEEVYHRNPISLIRRFSGGGTVLVDSDTVFVTWICNAESLQIPSCPSKIHQGIASFYQAALPLNLALMENDYAINQRKFGGNAQYLCKNRWLHHSSLLWDFDPANMHYLKMPTKVPNYRKNRSHQDFLCRLSDYLPSKEWLQKLLIQKLDENFKIEEVKYDDIKSYLDKEHRKATEYINNPLF